MKIYSNINDVYLTRRVFGYYLILSIGCLY